MWWKFWRCRCGRDCLNVVEQLIYSFPQMLSVVAFSIFKRMFCSWTCVSCRLLIPLFQKRILGDKQHVFLLAECPSCHPSISVEALKDRCHLLLEIICLPVGCVIHFWAINLATRKVRSSVWSGSQYMDCFWNCAQGVPVSTSRSVMAVVLLCLSDLC